MDNQRTTESVSPAEESGIEKTLEVNFFGGSVMPTEMEVKASLNNVDETLLVMKRFETEFSAEEKWKQEEAEKLQKISDETELSPVEKILALLDERDRADAVQAEKEKKEKDEQRKKIEMDMKNAPKTLAVKIHERSLKKRKLHIMTEQEEQQHKEKLFKIPNMEYGREIHTKVPLELQTDLQRAKADGNKELVNIIQKELDCRASEQKRVAMLKERHDKFVADGKMPEFLFDIVPLPNLWIDVFGCAKPEKNLNFYGMNHLLANYKEEKIRRDITTTIANKDGQVETIYYSLPKEIKTRNDEIVRLYGREFHEKDLLWFAILLKNLERMKQERGVNWRFSPLRVSANEMLKMANLAPNTTANREALKRFFRRAESTTIEVENEIYKFRGSLITTVFQDKIKGDWFYSFNSEIINFFAMNFTLLRIESLADMQSSLARILLMHLLSLPPTQELDQRTGIWEYKPKFFTWETLKSYTGTELQTKHFKNKICQPEIQEQMREAAYVSGFNFDMHVETCTEKGIYIGVQKQIPLNSPYQQLIQLPNNKRELPFFLAINKDEEKKREERERIREEKRKEAAERQRRKRLEKKEKEKALSKNEIKNWDVPSEF